MAGRYAYVAAAGSGLLIADLTNPAKPSEVATLATPGYAYGLAVSGNTVYVAGGWEGLETVDVTAKAAPRLLGQYRTEGWAMGVSVSGNQAYVAAALDGCSWWTSPTRRFPAEVGGLAVVGGDAAGVAVAGTIAYVADRNWGLEAVDLSAPADPVQVGFYGPLGFADGITAAGDYAYVAAGPYGLQIVDISDSARPLQVGAYDTQSYAKSVVVAGNHAYGAPCRVTSRGYKWWMSPDPTHPIRVGFLNDPYPTRDMAIASGVVYRVDERGLWLADVSDPTAPKQLSSLQIQMSNGQSTAAGLAVSGNVAYVAVSEHGLVTVDVSNPSTPAVIGQLQWPNAFAQHLAVGQGKAFIADTGDLTVADVSNPRAPVWLASYPTGGFEEGVTLASDQVFVANGGAGLSVIDVSHPSSPALAWSLRTLGYAESVFVREDLTLVADSSGGLLVLRAPGAGTASLGRTATSERAAVSQSMVPGAAPTRARYGQADSGGAPGGSASCVLVRRKQRRRQRRRHASRLLMNASSSATVTFDQAVFPTNRPATIAPRSELPYLLQGNLTIDASNAGVILDGGAAGPSSTGFRILSANNSIKGMQIVHFANAAIWVQGNSHNNLIGGSRNRGSGPLGEGNILSGNGFVGIPINGPNDTTTITGNLIGTDITGTAAMGNGGSGIIVSGSPNTTIGGSRPEERKCH